MQHALPKGVTIAYLYYENQTQLYKGRPRDSAERLRWAVCSVTI
jgi:hypothetical protein